jgi:type I restriction enzyme, R subunit
VEHAPGAAERLVPRVHRHAADRGRGGADPAGVRRLRLVYNFRDSIEDGATVPLYYENRIPELQLVNEDFERPTSSELLDEAALDPTRSSSPAVRRQYHLITRTERLDTIARDLVDTSSAAGSGQGDVRRDRQGDGGADVRPGARHWAEHLAELRRSWTPRPSSSGRGWQATIDFMESTDMAVVVSRRRTRSPTWPTSGSTSHPTGRMVEEDLDTAFKDPEDPLRLVFVCAMWMTGFDAPACSTIYLDKPMRNHTLMQTIARANRVFPTRTAG